MPKLPLGQSTATHVKDDGNEPDAVWLPQVDDVLLYGENPGWQTGADRPVELPEQLPPDPLPDELPDEVALMQFPAAFANCPTAAQAAMVDSCRVMAVRFGLWAAASTELCTATSELWLAPRGRARPPPTWPS